jgi:hypothetical protein
MEIISLLMSRPSDRRAQDKEVGLDSESYLSCSVGGDGYLCICGRQFGEYVYQPPPQLSARRSDYFVLSYWLNGLSASLFHISTYL